MTAEIITIGDEILIGQIVDTNSAWLGAELDFLGVSLKNIVSISDSEQAIMDALSLAHSRADLVLITGGLGPTKDDITKLTLCKYFGVPLRFDESVYRDIEVLFRSKGRKINDLNRNQAELPSNCEVLPNRRGTAPGMWFYENGNVTVSMPGVPYEMKEIFSQEVVPRLKKQFNLPFIYHRTLLTVGIPESVLADKISEFEDNLPEHVKLAYLPSLGQVRLRLSAVSQNESEAKALVNDQVDQLMPLIARYYFGEGSTTLAQAIGQSLMEKKMKLSLAESCTGGQIAHMVTSVPGSSVYFMGGATTYSEASKVEILGLDSVLIQQHGVVSNEVAEAMASCVRERFGADIALATTGIAGPDGGTEETPVGTIWIALSTGSFTFSKRYSFSNDRAMNIELGANTALNMLRKYLVGIDLKD
jgi:nicotinamide-nucleotide amidase